MAWALWLAARPKLNRGEDIAAAPARAHIIGPIRQAATLLRPGTEPEQPGPCALNGIKDWWSPSDDSGAKKRSYRSATAATGRCEGGSQASRPILVVGRGHECPRPRLTRP